MTGALDADEMAEEIRLRNAFISSCVGSQARLVHVSSSDVYGGVGAGAHSPNGSAGGPTGDLQAYEDETPLTSAATVSPIGLDRAHVQMTQQLIQTYGDSGGLDYTIVRVFNVLSERLDVLPRRDDAPPLERLCGALLRGEADVVPIHQDHLEEQTFVYIADVEDCLGRIVLDTEGQSSQEIFNIGNPENRASPADLARRVLERYRERHWDGRRPLPRFSEDYLNVRPSLQTSHTPNIEKALQLLDWVPGWPLTDAIDDALAHLFPRSSPQPTQM
jgi:nucleoside-diphosphate-sugar epimerase